VATGDAAPLPPVDPKCQFSNNTRTTYLGIDVFLIKGTGTLTTGQVCQIGKAQLKMQTDGDLVLRIVGKKGPQWAASWTQPNVKDQGAYVTFQPDENLVLRQDTGTMLWTSNTYQTVGGGHLAVQADGNVVVYTEGWQGVLWATNTDQK
jgi:hypothetical protein